MKQKIYLIILGLLLLFKTEIHTATTGILFEKNMGSKANGVGEAYTAMGEGIEVMAYNPAGLGRIEKAELNLTYNKGLLDISYGEAGYVRKLGEMQGIGIIIKNLYGGEMEIYNENGVIQNRIAERDYAIYLGYGKRILNKLYAGMNLKYLTSELVEESSAYSVAADFGVQYVFVERFFTGLSVQNLGTEMKYTGGKATGNVGDSLPLCIRFGAGYRFMDNERNKLLGLLDIIKYIDRDIKVHMGMEYIYHEKIAVRMGYKTGYDFQSVTAGIGININRYRLDYSFNFMGNLGSMQSISLGTGF